MTPDLLVALTAGVLIFGLLWKLEDQRQQNETERLVDWVVSPRTQATLDKITDLVAENKLILERHHAAAQEHRRSGQTTAAVERWRQGCLAIEQLAPDFLRALQGLRYLARTATVIVPLPPLAPNALRSRVLRDVAHLSRLAHDWLVTGNQQTRLRVIAVESVFRLGMWRLRRASERLKRREQEWTRVDGLVADLALCSDEGVTMARRILAAVDATENAD